MSIHKVTEQPYKWGFPQQPRVWRFSDKIDAQAKFEEIKQRYIDYSEMECWSVSEKKYDFASTLNGHEFTYKVYIEEVDFMPSIG